MKNSEIREAQEAIERSPILVAEKTLKMTRFKSYDIPKILTKFLKLYNDGNVTATEIAAKNILIKDQISKLIRTNGKFHLGDLIPFENPCPECSGTGEIFKFFREEVDVDCRKCNGTGKLLTKEGKKATCYRCRGEGHIKLRVISDKTKSSTICGNCNGRGFIEPKKDLKNPVITKKIAEEIKSK